MRSSDESRVWYIHHAGRRYGPDTQSALLHAADAGWLQPDDLVWWPGFTTWRAARDIPGLLSTVSTPLALPAPSAATQAPAPRPLAALPAPSPAAIAAPSQYRPQPRPEPRPQPQPQAPAAGRRSVPLRRKAMRAALAGRRSVLRWAEAPRHTLAPAGAYLLRHWRGELPLVQTFWLNTAAFFLAIQLTFKYLLTVAARAPGAADAVYGAYLALLVPALVWMFVGVWRAAERQKQSRGQISWPAVAQGWLFVWGVAIAATFAQDLGQGRITQADPGAWETPRKAAGLATPNAPRTGL